MFPTATTSIAIETLVVFVCTQVSSDKTILICPESVETQFEIEAPEVPDAKTKEVFVAALYTFKFSELDAYTFPTEKL